MIDLETKSTVVSRRELALLCRYSLAQTRLPLGLVVFGARLAAVAEIGMGNGLVWLRSYVPSMNGSYTPTPCSKRAAWHTELDTAGASVLFGAPSAVDLATVEARERGVGVVRVRNVQGVSLAPALTEAAARRGLSALVTIERYRGPTTNHLTPHNAPAIASCTRSVGVPGVPFVPLGGVVPFDCDAGDFTVIVAKPPAKTLDHDPSSIGDVSTSLSTRLPESVTVDFQVWTELLDFVGGTLPPDGRGLLTQDDEAALHDAGPGAGRSEDE